MKSIAGEEQKVPAWPCSICPGQKSSDFWVDSRKRDLESTDALLGSLRQGTFELEESHVPR
jgi:hypothetical protein